jgi:GNAT superfamily N-acetyltransferase
LCDGFATAKRADGVSFASRAALSQDFVIERVENDDALTRAAVEDGLRSFNRQLMGPAERRPLTLTLRSGDGRAIGGLIGRSNYRWLFIELLFVPEALRGRGVGKQLLLAAEEEAKKRNLIGLWLDTFNPEAAGFYEHCGFREIGAIDDYPPGHGRVFLARRIASA